jgi:hypothetical protein
LRSHLVLLKEPAPGNFVRHSKKLLFPKIVKDEETRMKTMQAIVFALSLGWAAQGLAQDEDLSTLDTSLAGVTPSASVVSSDFETIFVKQDKDFPEQVAAMIKAETTAWEEHSKKLDKSWWNKGIDYCRSYREGYRHSFHNGYRYAKRYQHGYQYQSNSHSARDAYVYS